MSMSDLPEWVWQVIEATQQYDEEHPMLWRQEPGGGYNTVRCLDSILEPLIPEQVWDAARVMRARRERAPE